MDAQTEKEVIEKILGKMNSLTRVVIAHRVSTIKDADRIVYMENGSIRAVGKYSEIVDQIPSFGIDQNLG